MPSDDWEYDDTANRYRNKRSGKLLPKKTLLELRNEAAELAAAGGAKSVNRLIGRTVDLAQWELDMRAMIRYVYSAQYMLGRGGRNNMTSRDWGIVGAALKKQYTFLHGFAEELASGSVSEGRARQRALLYIKGSVQMYERAEAETRQIRSLPQYPGDGNTQCLGNCQCYLEYNLDKARGVWRVYWRLSVAEHCPDCVALAGEWAPLEIPVNG